MKKKEKIIIFAIILIILYIIFGPFLGSKFVNEKIDRNSPWYVNDLYMSDQYYYEHILSDSQKELYSQLFHAINNMEKEITVSYSYDDVMKTMDAILLDHPEMINLTTYTFSYSNNSSTTVKPKYLTRLKFILDRMVAKAQKEVTKVEKKTRGMSEYEKELYIYEWLGKNSRYRRDAFRNSDQSAYTALIKSKNTVCSGFGKGAQILFQNVGIDSHILLSDDHIWNLVKIEDEYYYFDATNTYVANCYNTVCHSGLNTTYYSDPRYGEIYATGFPFPNGTKYNYYEYNDLVISSFSELDRIASQTDKNAEFIEFKLSNGSANDFFNLLRSNKSKTTELGLTASGGLYYDNMIIVKKDY